MNSVSFIYKASLSGFEERKFESGVARWRYVAEKINGFGRLNEGWHFGEGVPATEDNVRDALSILKSGVAHGLWRVNAFPGVEGSVLVSFKHGEDLIEIEVENGAATCTHERGREEISFDESITVGEATEKLIGIAKQLCTFAPFTLSISMNSTVAGTEWLSSHRATAASPSSVPRVLRESQVASVRISERFTPPSLLIPPFTGDFATSP